MSPTPWWVLVGLAAWGCDEPRAADDPPVFELGHRLVRERVDLGRVTPDSPTAFALVPSPTGALLVWVPRSGESTLSSLELARDGEPKSPPQPIGGAHAPGRASDLVAGRLGRGFVASWVEQMGEEARLLALRADGRPSPQLLDLGHAWRTHKVVRGNVALSVDQDRALIFARGGAEPCAGSDERDCFSFGLFSVLDDVVEPRGLPLVVPTPCEQNSAHFASAGGHWLYGVCRSGGGERVTTLFDIQFSPEYARAEPLLRGCQPLDVARFRDQHWLVGECGETRKLARIVGATGDPVTLDIGQPSLECSERRIVLTTRQGKQPIVGPRDDVAALLPRKIAGHLSQVAAVGDVLLVANAGANGVEVDRYRCDRAAKP